MRTLLFTIALTLAALHGGCAGLGAARDPGPYVTFDTMPLEPGIKRSYTLGQVEKAAIGDPILSVGYMAILPIYEVSFDFQPPMLDGRTMPLLRAGLRFAVHRAIEEDSLYFLYNPDYDIAAGIVAARDGSVRHGWARITYDSALLLRAQEAWEERVSRGSEGDDDFAYIRGPMTGDQLYWSSTHGADSFPKQRLFTHVADSVRTGPFHAEIVFAGMTGDTVEAVYNEYLDGVPRPAHIGRFRQSLAQSRIIAYKSLRIEVMAATERQIEYRVLSDGNLPWVKYPKRR